MLLQNQLHPKFAKINEMRIKSYLSYITSICFHKNRMWTIIDLQGMTRLFLTKIPFFREVIVSSFCCDVCGYTNAELQPGGSIQDRGVTYKLNIETVEVRVFFLLIFTQKWISL